jgi:hypothetical protein
LLFDRFLYRLQITTGDKWSDIAETTFVVDSGMDAAVLALSTFIQHVAYAEQILPYAQEIMNIMMEQSQSASES